MCGRRNIKVAFANDVLRPYRDVSEPFTGFLTEGPTVVKVKNDWLIYFDQYRDKTYGAVQTSDFKTFTNISKEVSVPKDHKHGTIIPIDARTLKKLRKQAPGGAKLQCETVTCRPPSSKPSIT